MKKCVNRSLQIDRIYFLNVLQKKIFIKAQGRTLLNAEHKEEFISCWQRAEVHDQQISLAQNVQNVIGA